MKACLFLAVLFASTLANAALMPSDMFDDCASGEIARVKPWIEKGLVNAGGFGATCLILAAEKDHTDLGIYLLNAGADVNMYGSDVALPALYLATIRKNYSLIEAMLQHGGNPWLVNGNFPSKYPWQMFVVNDDVKALQIYLLKGWNPEGNLSEANPLEFAARSKAFGVAKELTKYASLLNSTVMFNSESAVSSAPLVSAIEIMDSDMALFLINAGANPNSISFKSMTYNSYFAAMALGAAAQRGMVDVASALIHAGAYVNPPEKTQDIYYYLESPLCSAAAGSTYHTGKMNSTIKVLLQAKANVDICRSPWNQPLEYIPTPLYVAIRSGLDLEKIEALVDGGANVNAPFVDTDNYRTKNWSPLSYAIALGKKEVADYLKLHGAK